MKSFEFYICIYHHNHIFDKVCSLNRWVAKHLTDYFHICPGYMPISEFLLMIFQSPQWRCQPIFFPMTAFFLFSCLRWYFTENLWKDGWLLWCVYTISMFFFLTVVMRSYNVSYFTVYTLEMPITILQIEFHFCWSFLLFHSLVPR